MNQTRYIDNPFDKIFKIVNPDTDQLYNQLLELLQKFFDTVKIPSATSYCSIPAKSKEDPYLYVGTAGYIVMFLRLHDYFLKKSEQKSEKFISQSHLVGDEGVNKFTDPCFYLKLAEEQYVCLTNYILSHRKTVDCFSYFMSEVSIWVCGMHIGYKTKNLPLFKDNEHRMRTCYEELKKNLRKHYLSLY